MFLHDSHPSHPLTPRQSEAPPRAVGSRLPTRPGRTYWAVLAFLIGFTILLIGVGTYFLIPAMDAATSTGVTPKEKRTLVAVSRLMLAVVLFVIFAGLILTFRVGRFFFPRKSTPRTQTRYVDAWAEAGKRMQPPEE